MIDKKRLDAHLNNGEREYIMCAANHHDDGKDHLFQPYNIDKGYVIGGWRHPCIGQVFMATHPDAKRWDDCIQGFLTNKNRFLTREEGLELVKTNGQLKGNIQGGELTSEDLW
jgi:hypothetical protein